VGEGIRLVPGEFGRKKRGIIGRTFGVKFKNLPQKFLETDAETSWRRY